MDVFDLRSQLIGDYESFVTSFLQFRDQRIEQHVRQQLDDGHLWPEPMVGLNPSYESGGTITELVADGRLHPTCADIFRAAKSEHSAGRELRLHRHQAEAIDAARRDANYVLTTGTGSGKSLSYIVPIVDHVLRVGSGGGIKAIVVYPMNALANSQLEELGKFLGHGFGGRPPVTFARYTGQESREEKDAILLDPPDILLTNYVMLELILTRVRDKRLISAANQLRFLVLDELHTYRGRQGADVAFLVRRLRQACRSDHLRVIGTSATMATGSYDERRRAVADVATTLFGDTVLHTDVIGETLRRATPEIDVDDPAVRQRLTERVSRSPLDAPTDFDTLRSDPLSSWIESTFGIERDGERLERVTPRSIGGPEGASADLAALCGLEERGLAEQAIQAQLLAGSSAVHPDTGFPLFAFRLHQFISRGHTVFGSIEAPSKRSLYLKEQRTVPGNPDKALLPLAFCRACGQEYYTVFREEDEMSRFTPRPVDLRSGDEEQAAGFLYLPPDDPKLVGDAWPTDVDQVLERVPEEWIDPDADPPRIKPDRRKQLPQELFVGTDGTIGGGQRAWWVPAPFRFCLACGVAYGGRVRSDLTKLVTLGSGGRSSALTELSVSVVRWLRGTSDLPDFARKLLAFTDNRQDASLQAGHFNDFVLVTLLRTALTKALEKAGAAGIRHDQLAQAVFDVLELPLDAYALNPEVKYLALEETNRTLREVLGYLLYQDLERGWRVTQPNLEQCGLLRFEYAALDTVCGDEDNWQNAHPALVNASPEARAAISRVLLDFLRRELVIDVDYLDAIFQEQMVRRSDQHLKGRWAIDEDQRELNHASDAVIRSRKPSDYQGFTYLSPRGAVGQYLRRPSTFPQYGERITLSESAEILEQLVASLHVAGILRQVPGTGDDPRYRVAASAMVWAAGDGTRQVDDPLRVTRPPEGGLPTNKYFVDLYRRTTIDLATLEAREHTAQVQAERREFREQQFRTAALPVLFCSPTMELGVDISELNVVGLRNAPPTPANYAQRSGRAGRGGQPALVFTYCTSGSPHDQYYFRHPELMVAGRVAAPRIDLANEDLVRSHVQAVWLSESGMSLGGTMAGVVDLGHISEPHPALMPSIAADLADGTTASKALRSAKAVLDSVASHLDGALWWSDEWLARVLDGLSTQFERSAQRWWDMYRQAVGQRDSYNAVIADHTRAAEEKKRARRLRDEAEKRIELLVAESGNFSQHDFDPYRYFAAEGFLPGYSFPRLPITAYIPGRRGKADGEFLQRARFLAVSEFGPRALVYHEGSRYRIPRVALPVVAPSSDDPDNLVTSRAKRCAMCGYIHPLVAEPYPDVCEQCGAELEGPLRDLFRLSNVTTRRQDRINSDEEERQRQGFELIAGVRFAERDRHLSRRSAQVMSSGGTEIARLVYGPTATVWRLNLGWRRRKNPNQHGFTLDLNYGTWAKSEEAVDDTDTTDAPDERMTARTKRVIPYVDDTRNILILEFGDPLPLETMAALEASLKRAIQVVFQLEENELASEPLPSSKERSVILFYESAEGGAGVLRQLVSDPDALDRVVHEALTICHADPDTGNDVGDDVCSVACYDCLLSYSNQTDHEVLDRRRAVPILRSLRGARTVEIQSEAPTIEAHVEHLDDQAESDLERRFIEFLTSGGYRIPSRGRHNVSVGTTPDFEFTLDGQQVAVYVDGPPHEFPERQQRDAAIRSQLRDLGWRIARFRHNDDWPQVVDTFSDVFGTGAPR
ncbi:MAG TPA: DEAD/DEAH box helicase [Microthrixaceae bacterium]|nr:DEAD/DEAH box helicase [Microthrixaceae bacterium]